MKLGLALGGCGARTRVCTDLGIRDTDFLIVPGIIIQGGKLVSEALSAASRAATLAHANPMTWSAHQVTAPGDDRGGGGGGGVPTSAVAVVAASAATATQAASAMMPEDAQLLLDCTMNLPRLRFTLSPTVGGGAVSSREIRAPGPPPPLRCVCEHACVKVCM